MHQDHDRHERGTFYLSGDFKVIDCCLRHVILVQRETISDQARDLRIKTIRKDAKAGMARMKKGEPVDKKLEDLKTVQHDLNQLGQIAKADLRKKAPQGAEAAAAGEANR